MRPSEYEDFQALGEVAASLLGRVQFRRQLRDPEPRRHSAGSGSATPKQRLDLAAAGRKLRIRPK